MSNEESKANKELFENVTFNDAAYAKDIRDKSAAKLEKLKIALIIAAIATICSIIAFKFSKHEALSNVFFVIAVVGAIASYILGGGINIAIKWALKIGKIGWFILPFPIDIATGLFAILFSLLSFFFLPVIFVALNYYQANKDYKAAEEYLSFYQPTQE